MSEKTKNGDYGMSSLFEEKKVRVLFLHVGAEMYGSDKVLAQLVNGVDKSKFTPVVVLPQYGPLYDLLDSNEIDVRVIPYPLLRRSSFTPVGIFKYLFELIKSVKILKRFVRQEKIDIIHSNTIAVLEGALVSKITGIQHVWHIHEIIENPRIFMKFMGFVIGKFADRIVAISKATESALLKSKSIDRLSTEVIYDGIDVPDERGQSIRSEIGIHDDDFVVGHIGRINSWKGQKDFILAGVPILESFEDAHLILSGSTFEGQEWREEELKDLISSFSHVSNRIHFLGYRHDTNNVYASMNVFVSSSTKPEPFSMVTIEAMSNYVPVIAYDSAGPSEIVLDEVTGVLVEPGSIKKLSIAMEDLYLNPDKVRSMGILSRQRVVEDFNLKKFVDSFENLYMKMFLNK